MPTVTLTYQLPEEQRELDLALKAGDYCSALFDIVTELRSRVKNSKPDRDVAGFYEWMWLELNERGIDPFA